MPSCRLGSYLIFSPIKSKVYAGDQQPEYTHIVIQIKRKRGREACIIQVRNGRHPIHRHNTDSHLILHHKDRQIGIGAEIGMGIVGGTGIVGATEIIGAAVVRTTVAIARLNAAAAADTNHFYRLT